MPADNTDHLPQAGLQVSTAPLNTPEVLDNYEHPS